LCTNDINVTVTALTTFSLTSTGLQPTSTRLQAVSEISHEADKGDTFICGLEQGPGTEWTTTVEELVAAFYNPDFASSVHLPGCTWTVAKKEITCSYPLSLPIAGVPASIDQLTPAIEGLVLDGTVAFFETPAPTLLVNEHPTLVWIEPNICQEPFEPYAEIELALLYQGSPPSKPNLPSGICDYTGNGIPAKLPTTQPDLSIVEKKIAEQQTLDPLKQFTPFLGVYDGIRVRLHLPISQVVGGAEPAPPPGSIPGTPGIPEPGKPLSWPAGTYFHDPYPLRAVIWTTYGVRYVESSNVLPLPPPKKPLTKLEQVELGAWKELNCVQWTVWQPQQIFKYRWWPDPPWESLVQGAAQEHLWRVAVTGMSNAREIEVSLGGGTIATARPSAAGVAHLDLLLEGGRDDGFQLAAMPSDGDVGAMIRIEQTPLIPAGQLQLPAMVETFALSAFSPILAWCVTAAGVLLYQLDTPGPPRLLRRFEDLDVHGVIPLSRSQALFWGDRGITIRDGTRRGATRTITSEQVLAAAQSDGVLFVLGRDKLIVYDELQRPLASWRRPRDAVAIGCTQRALVIAAPSGLAIYDRAAAVEGQRTRDGAPTAVNELNIPGVVGILPADHRWSRHELVLQERDGSSTVLELSDPSRPHLAAHVSDHRWAQVRRVRDVAALPDKGRSRIGLFWEGRPVVATRAQIEGTTPPGHVPIGVGRA
jgi:hypothetical protein